MCCLFSSRPKFWKTQFSKFGENLKTQFLPSGFLDISDIVLAADGTPQVHNFSRGGVAGGDGSFAVKGGRLSIQNGLIGNMQRSEKRS
jgi:hypothetical protein